jgi:hypothetical protein
LGFCLMSKTSVLSCEKGTQKFGGNLQLLTD